MLYRKTRWYRMNEYAEVEANSLEEAKEMFKDPKYRDYDEWEDGGIRLRYEETYSRFDPDTEEWEDFEE